MKLARDPKNQRSSKVVTYTLDADYDPWNKVTKARQEFRAKMIAEFGKKAVNARYNFAGRHVL